ncbi:MAG: radical SAM protein [Desulfomonilaceae bacterium]
MIRPGEKGAILKSRKAPLSIALVYPNVYRVGMANLGFQFLYKYLNSFPDIRSERFFLPDAASEKYGILRGVVSEETARPLTDFPLIAFSIPFENDYLNVPRILSAAGIPPLENDRRSGDPVIVAGGVSISMNPEPLAPFLDLAFIGEIDDNAAENFWSLLADILSGHSMFQMDRKYFKKQFQNIPGVYVPSAYKFHFNENGTISEISAEPGFPHMVHAVKRRSKKSSIPVSVLFSSQAEFGESFLIETNRGCGRGCRFCAGGWIHFPVRHAGFARFRQEVDEAIDSGRTIGLIGSDLAGHPELEEILAHIVERGGKFSLSSIRPEGLTPQIMKFLGRTGQKTATLAPETASPRMKKVIGKEIASERFYELVDQLVTAGIPNLRFYFMVGLPTETCEDVESIVDFVLQSRKIFVEASRPQKKIGKIGVQVNAFVPKPWTPFQWAAMWTINELERRFRIIRKALSKEPNLAVRVESAKQAVIQGLLSRGDRRIAPAVLMAADQTGSLSGVIRNREIDLNFYVHRERPADEIFPWDVTFHGITKKKLRKIYDHAISHISYFDAT